MKIIRLCTLIRNLGIPVYIDSMDTFTSKREADYFADCVRDKRIITIFHGENCKEKFWGEPGNHRVNTVGFILFPKPIPDNIGLVIGVESKLGKLKEMQNRMDTDSNGR